MLFKSFLSFFQKVRAMVKELWKLLFGSSEVPKELQKLPEFPEFQQGADPKFPSYNKDCLEVRGKVYRHQTLELGSHENDDSYTLTDPFLEVRG